MEGFDERRFQYRFFNKYERDDFRLTQYGYHRWSKETAHAPTIKDSYVLHIVLEGKGFVRVKNKQYQVLPGNAFLIRPENLSIIIRIKTTYGRIFGLASKVILPKNFSFAAGSTNSTTFCRLRG